MSVVILRIAAALYACATAAYLVYFARPKHARLATVGASLLSVAFVVHGISIGVGCSEYGGAEFFSLRGGTVLMLWLGAGAYLLLQRFYHLPSIGAFVTPLLLIALLPALFGTPDHPELPPAAVRNPTLTLHIVTAGLGGALFGIAFGAAVMYLLQEREVKGKKFGALFPRLPPLASLDRMVQRLVRAGFVVYTVALVAGTLTATVVWKSAWSWDPKQIGSVIVWIFYGALVQLRHSGVHGRRFAVLALVGFLLVLGERATMRLPGVTRHSGDYGTSVTQQGGAQ